MTRLRKTFAVCASLVGTVVGMLACGVRTDGMPTLGVQALDAWARPADSGATSAAYLVLANRGSAADTVIGVVTDAAESAMVHQTMQQGPTMRMAALPAVALPVGAEVALAPLGTHVMLLRLRQSLRVGDTVRLGFVLTSGDTLPVRAVTRAP